jgi:hypothetical protein
MIQTTRALYGAWIALLLITVLSYVIADSADIARNIETAIVIAAAAVKGRIILIWFMGARSFPIKWRMFFDAWLLINTAVIIGFHLSAHG